ncbi:AAA family ATPase [Kibdelosporangium philippinense]|uniref:AAA family ATPase n=1 Tax=Kibdelosporangium philippinense TaxID=211113 RepID=A0ABS8ZSS0_9PSEU|nr:LuxR family transcriptional regulator [Kibdelosporangium philippinense]MCE7010778.1 AAA family ATPase [Kibdelosporangium philippinense]
MRLIGRTAELTALLESILAGGLTLLTGAPGIGKSRLAEEALAECGLNTLVGRAHPLHAGLAYAPIVEALRPAVQRATDFAALTDLGKLFGDPQLPVAPALDNPEAERARMFGGVAELIRQVGPAVLFVDDVHWADRGTVALLQHVSRHCPVLVTSRTDESSIQADAIVELGPLPDVSVAELARDLLGKVPSAELLSTVTERAQGVPLFVTALLQGGLTSLPAVIKDVVLARLDQLSGADRRQLELIAVAGTLPGDHAGMARLISQGLVVEADGSYRVAHPLYAEVAYDALTIGERRTLHAAVIDMLDDEVAKAPHYLQAGDLVDKDHAIAALAKAGRRAMLVNAGDEAVQYVSAALQISGPDLALMDMLGQAYLRAGRITDAIGAWNQSAELARRLGENDKLSALRFRLALMESEAGHFAKAETHALDGSVPITDTASQTIALRMIYTLRHNDPDRARQIISHHSVSPNPHPAAVASEALRQQLAALLNGELIAARDHAAAAFEHSQKWKQDWPVLDNYAMHALISLNSAVGAVGAAVVQAKQALEAQTVTGVSPSGSTARLDLNMTYYLAGDLVAGTAASAVGVQRARDAGMPRSLARALYCHALFLAERGKLMAAKDLCAEARAISVGPEPGLTALRESVETALAIHSGHPELAPPLDYWALYHEPMPMIVRMIFAWRAGVVAPCSGHGPLLDAVAAANSSLLESMGAPLLAAEARLASTDGVVACIKVFENAGARPWADRARRAARAAGLHPPNPSTKGPLTKRETDVARLVGYGLSNADISAQLLISERTVEAHLTSAYAKLRLSSRIRLAHWAAENID